MRVILLAHPRTGSNLLRGILGSHGEVTMYNELFNLHQFGQDIVKGPISRLQKFHERNVSLNQRVYGFKLLYDQCSFEDFIFYSDKYDPHQDFLNRTAEVVDLKNSIGQGIVESRFRLFWQYIVADTSTSIIHLRRRNYLRTYISLLRALRTDQWTGQELRAVAPIILDVEACASFFKHIEKKEEYYSELFQKHNIVDVFYEDLLRNPKAEIEHVAQFLGVSTAKFSIPLLRVSEDIAQLIVNLDELREYFKETPWARFIES